MRNERQTQPNGNRNITVVEAGFFEKGNKNGQLEAVEL
jgi:hypothetical protein